MVEECSQLTLRQIMLGSDRWLSFPARRIDQEEAETFEGASYSPALLDPASEQRP